MIARIGNAVASIALQTLAEHPIIEARRSQVRTYLCGAQLRFLSCIRVRTMHEWMPLTPGQLRSQALKLRSLARYVSRPDVAQHLEEHAARLFAEAELKNVAAAELCLQPAADIGPVTIAETG